MYKTQGTQFFKKKCTQRNSQRIEIFLFASPEYLTAAAPNCYWLSALTN